jgi:hypothetical protein
MRILIILLATAVLAVPALAGEIDFGDVRPKKDAFKDLPGVKMPESVTTLKTKNPCTSEIRSQRWQQGHSMPVRVWSCQNGNMLFESTRPPMLDDLKTYQDDYAR